MLDSAYYGEKNEAGKVVHAKSFQSCQTLWNPIDRSLPGSIVHGILQARTLEWVAVPSSRDLPDQGLNTCLLCLIGRQVLYH